MVFKHGLIPLEVHSWLTANLAATLSREAGHGHDIQALSWFYGLIHDAGVLSLRHPHFNHSNVGQKEVELLLEMIERKYGVPIKTPIAMSDMEEFAQRHALSHRRGSRPIAMVEKRIGAEVVRSVISADQISTGREKLGFQSAVLPIFRTYRTDYVFDTPHRRHNIACFLEHTIRIRVFKGLLESKAEEVRGELNLPHYDPVITGSTWAIEYYLSTKDNADLLRRSQEFLDGRRAKGEISAETPRGAVTIRTRDKESTMSSRCVLCGKPGRFYKGIRDSPEVMARKKALKGEGVSGPESTIHMGRGDVGRVLGFELDTWRGQFDGKVRPQDHQLGVCDDCAAALDNNRPVLEGLIVYLPLPDDVFEYYHITQCRRKLREWEEYSKQGRCSPDPRFFDLVFWQKTPDYSRTLGGFDERRAKYERALQIFKESVDVFGARNNVVYGSIDLSSDSIEKLTKSSSDLAPMSYGCIKASKIGKVVVNGFTFERRVAAWVLKLIMAKVKLNPSIGPAGNLKRIFEGVGSPSKGDLDLMMSEYERVVEALSV